MNEENALKVHPRYYAVERARRTVNEALWTAIDEERLTYMEVLKVLNELAATLLRYGIRQERHPDDPDAYGDEE